MELDSFVSTMVPYKLANNATENSNSNSKRAEREIEEMEKDGKKSTTLYAVDLKLISKLGFRLLSRINQVK